MQSLIVFSMNSVEGGTTDVDSVHHISSATSGLLRRG